MDNGQSVAALPIVVCGGRCDQRMKPRRPPPMFLDLRTDVWTRIEARGGTEPAPAGLSF